MSDQKTVFISYRRTHTFEAELLYDSLAERNYDVFLDFKSLHRGSFPAQLMGNIRARAHFVLVLGKGTLTRCLREKDFVRMEIEQAIKYRRNTYLFVLPDFEDRTDCPDNIREISAENAQNCNISLADFQQYTGINLRSWTRVEVTDEDYTREKPVKALIKHFKVAMPIEIEKYLRWRVNPRLLLCYEKTDEDKARRIVREINGYVISLRIHLKIKPVSV